mmetsp:Transcript_60990/g.125733  ORF Transcript_60990/g.125733 Transcript_60990/m.125733 type:complete len:211 (-) Transcript_60990:228-860(-)
MKTVMSTLVSKPGHTNVKGFTGAAQRCPNVKLCIPTVSRDGEPLLLHVPGPSILHTGAHGLLLSHSRWQKAGFDITLRPGNKHNPRDGGFIRTPEGHVINLDFRDDLYYLPVHTPAKPSRTNHLRALTSAAPPVPSSNPYSLLEDDDTDPSLCGWTAADIDTSHRAWCHPVVPEAPTRVCDDHPPPKRVRFSPETSTRSRLADDDFLHAL